MKTKGLYRQSRKAKSPRRAGCGVFGDSRLFLFYQSALSDRRFVSYWIGKTYCPDRLTIRWTRPQLPSKIRGLYPAPEALILRYAIRIILDIMNFISAQCPYCKQTLLRAKVDSIEITTALVNGRKYKGVAYSCTSCNATLSISMDQISLNADLESRIKKLLHRGA